MLPTRAGRAERADVHSARRSIFATIECQERRFHIPLGLSRGASVGFEQLKIDPGQTWASKRCSVCG